MENCPMTDDFIYYNGVLNIKQQLKNNFPNIKISGIYVYGSKKLIDQARKEWDETGVVLRDIPSGLKNAVDKAMVLDMFKYAHANLPPSYIILISGDGDFAKAVKELDSLGYTIILAMTEKGCSQKLPEFCDHIVPWKKLFGKPVKRSTLWKNQEPKSLELKHPIKRGLDNNIVTKVLWDIKGCSIEKKLHKKAVMYIVDSLEDKLGKSSITLDAYGPQRRQDFIESLEVNSVNYITITDKKEESLENVMLVDILTFAIRHHPCNILIILVDKDLSSVCHFLSDYRYNVMVAVLYEGKHKHLEDAGTFLFKNILKMQEPFCSKTFSYVWNRRVPASSKSSKCF